MDDDTSLEIISISYIFSIQFKFEKTSWFVRFFTNFTRSLKIANLYIISSVIKISLMTNTHFANFPLKSLTSWKLHGYLIYHIINLIYELEYKPTITPPILRDNFIIQWISIYNNKTWNCKGYIFCG